MIVKLEEAPETQFRLPCYEHVAPPEPEAHVAPPEVDLVKREMPAVLDPLAVLGDSLPREPDAVMDDALPGEPAEVQHEADLVFTHFPGSKVNMEALPVCAMAPTLEVLLSDVKPEIYRAVNEPRVDLSRLHDGARENSDVDDDKTVSFTEEDVQLSPHSQLSPPSSFKMDEDVAGNHKYDVMNEPLAGATLSLPSPNHVAFSSAAALELNGLEEHCDLIGWSRANSAFSLHINEEPDQSPPPQALRLTAAPPTASRKRSSSTCLGTKLIPCKG